MKDESFIIEAISQAHKSVFAQRLGAVVVSNNKIVGRGFNYAHSTGQPFGDGEHAEVAALNNTTAKYRKNSTVYVVRLDKFDTVRNSKPCSTCITIMQKLGVKYAWYSDDDGSWHRMML